jgi:hypothetical protein
MLIPFSKILIHLRREKIKVNLKLTPKQQPSFSVEITLLVVSPVILFSSNICTLA